MIKICPTCNREIDLDKDACFTNIESGTPVFECGICRSTLIDKECEKAMFYKVFQDKNCMDIGYCVVLPDDAIDAVRDSVECGNEFHPVFEPVFMSAQEFSELPEFEGY